MRAYIPLLALTLGGCSASEIVQNWTVPPAQDLAEPNYRRIVTSNINAFFGNAPPTGEVEISGVRPVDHLKGPAWLTCLRFEARGYLRHYTIFIQDGKILEWRVSVVIDQCHKEPYTLLELPGKKPGT